MKSFIAVFTVVAALVLPSQAACNLSPSESATVSGLLKQYEDAWLGGNPEQKVMALFTADATVLPHHGVKPMTGREQIKSFWFPAGGLKFKLLKLTHNVENVEGCGDLAFGWGKSEVEWQVQGETSTKYNAGTMLFVAKKEGGKWKLHRLMWDDPPNQTRP
jgi:uncharacterized protein (TIGR02246 family)